MSLLDEVNKVAGMILEKYPDATVYRLGEPSHTQNGVFLVQLKQEIRKHETRAHSLVERQYLITCYDETIEQVMIAMDELSRYLMNERIELPVRDSTKQHVRIDSFSITSTYKTQNEQFACEGLVLTQARELRQTEKAEKIKQVIIS